MKYRILLLLSLFTFSAFPKAPRSTTPSKRSQPNLYSIASKLQDEVVSLEAEAQRLIDFGKECISKRNSLINDMDNIIWKIDKGEITYRNDEIKDIRNRIDNLYYKDKARGQIGNEINKRKLAVECKLEENPKLKNLIYMVRLYDKIDEYNNLVDDNKYDYQMSKSNSELWNIYYDKRDNFRDKTENFSSISELQNELNDIAMEYKTLISDDKKLLLKMVPLMKDIDIVIGKINKREITNYNNEIKNINNRIGNLDNKNDDIIRRQDELDNRENAVRKIKEVENLLDWTNCKKWMDKWNDFVDEEDQPKWDIYNKKLDALRSKTKEFPVLRKLQNELANITNGWQTLLSDDKNLLSEMALLINDIDKIIGKIDRREITNYNNEIKNINNRIGNLDNKNDDIIRRQDELDNREDAVRKTHGLGYIAYWTDCKKAGDEWNDFVDEEDQPKWDIYNDKVESFNNKTANLPNHP